MQEVRPNLGLNQSTKFSTMSPSSSTPTNLSNGQHFQSTPFISSQVIQQPAVQLNKLPQQQSQYVPHPASPNATNYMTQHQNQAENLVQTSKFFVIKDL